MATPLGQDCADATAPSRTRCELVLEILALRHQIAILERTGTRRPCIRPFDRVWSKYSDALNYQGLRTGQA